MPLTVLLSKFAAAKVSIYFDLVPFLENLTAATGDPEAAGKQSFLPF